MAFVVGMRSYHLPHAKGALQEPVHLAQEFHLLLELRQTESVLQAALIARYIMILCARYGKARVECVLDHNYQINAGKLSLKTDREIR